MSAVREQIDEELFEWLIRGGTISFIIPSSQRGSCPKVDICVKDLGYARMIQIISAAMADGEQKLGMIASVGHSP